jgi:Rrf2 family protein
MKLGEGVEWAIHVCALLAGVPGRRIPVDQLAGFHELPKPYLAKQLQALAAAQIIDGSKGRGGGYQLSRPPSQVSLLDIVLAVEGNERAFRCTEIRRCGPAAKPAKKYTAPCAIASAMWSAEAAWRRELANVTLAQIVVETVKALEPEQVKIYGQWFGT